MNAEVAAYIAQCRAQGFSDDDIRVALAEAGWSAAVIAEALPEGSVPVGAELVTPQATAVEASNTEVLATEMPAIEAQAAPLSTTEASQPVTATVVEDVQLRADQPTAQPATQLAKKRSILTSLFVLVVLLAAIAAAYWFFLRAQDQVALSQDTLVGANNSRVITVRQLSPTTVSPSVSQLGGIFGNERKRTGGVALAETSCKDLTVVSKGDAASLVRSDDTSGRPLDSGGSFTTYTTLGETALIQVKNKQGEVCLSAAVLDSAAGAVTIDAASTALAVVAPLGAITTEKEVEYFKNAPKMAEFTLWLSGKLKLGPLTPLLNTTNTNYTPDQAELNNFVSVINQQASEARRKK